MQGLTIRVVLAVVLSLVLPVVLSVALSVGVGAVGGAAAATEVPAQPGAQARTVTLASTTSTEQTGLFKHLLPAFTRSTGIAVRVVAVGTGQALEIGRRGDADVLLVHDRLSEDRFVAEGHGVSRRTVMYNDFVLVGPAADPAAAKGSDIAAALRRVAGSKATFVSRGDNSGTHAAELRYWQLAGIATPTTLGGRLDYRPCGCGMGAALNMAASTDAYVLSDRGSWLAFRNPAGLGVLVEGDTRLYNEYGVIVVNPAKHPHVHVGAAQAFADWLVSRDGQAAIDSYRVAGKQLFFANAGR